MTYRLHIQRIEKMNFNLTLVLFRVIDDSWHYRKDIKTFLLTTESETAWEIEWDTHF